MPIGSSSSEPEEGLGTTAARGVLWTGGGQVLRQIVQVATSVLLARLLMPADFGLLGMALVFYGLVQLFADFGLGAAIVQVKELTGVALSSSFWLNVLVAVVLALALAISAPWIASFYGDPRLAAIITVLSIGLVFGGFVVVPRAILYKGLRFAEIAKAQVAGSIIGGVCAVAMAWLGFGVWSLVVQPLVGSATTMLLTVLYARWVPDRSFQWASIRKMTGFSAAVLGADMVNYAHREGDNLLVGKFLGSGPLGYYSLAYQLMLYPMNQVSQVIVRILFPLLSTLQDELARYREVYLKAVAAIAFLTFPMMVGLFAVAHDLVTVVFGAKWLPMLPVLQILCWVGMLQSVGTTAGLIYLSTGHAQRRLVFSLFATPVFLTFVVLGLPWGVVGVAGGYALAAFLVAYANYWVAFRLVKLPLRTFHASLARPAGASALMFLAVKVAQWWIGGHMHWLVGERLAFLVGIGVITYGLISIVINRAQIAEIKSLFMSVRATRTAASGVRSAAAGSTGSGDFR
ncbi:MAG: colanic acid exporter [Chromatiales bacterium 21-64-14]|nr:MAG: colanic acid exporter [Chromatiales bacterium 21-64-14]HQU16085.1 MOP flippase family protein [Gammaproteobacteria bacterium]